MSRPTTAFRLLVLLQYAHYPIVEVSPDRLYIPSVRKVARLLGTESKRVNTWLRWLEDMSYISNLAYSPNKRSVTLKLSRPRNV